MKKLKNQKGETLVETLVSLLIIVLVFVFLTGSAVAAAKINAKIRDTDVSFRYSDAQSDGNAQLRLSGRSGQTGSTSVEVYQENGYRVLCVGGYAMRKLRDRRGITLTEMLCTVLIVLLLTALLVVGIRFASKTYTESMRLSEAQELCSTLTSVISDKLRFCGTVTQDENGGLTQIFIQNVGSVEGKGDAFQIGEDGQLALGDRHLLGSASYPKGLQVTAFTLRYDASTDIFSVTLEIGDRSRQTLSQTSFEVKRINRTVT